MNELKLDSFEISIKSDIKGIKPKAKRRGYAKELVEKLYPTIEQALADGCSYEQIAEVLLHKNIKISSSTLKRYHKANKKTKKTNSQNPQVCGNEQKIEAKENTDLDRSQSDSSTDRSLNRLPNYSQSVEISMPKNQKNPISVSQILSGSALTDEDYADDFNDY